MSCSLCLNTVLSVRAYISKKCLSKPCASAEFTTHFNEGVGTSQLEKAELH